MSTNNRTPGIICLAHLGWDSIWQRPHHLMSRLARRYPVLYINEPEIDDTYERRPFLRPVDTTDTISAWQPVFPSRDEVLERWRKNYVECIRDLLLREGWLRDTTRGVMATRPLILWFYTPTPFYVLDHIPSDLVVYDVMDELSNFKGAAEDLSLREARLLENADVVFAGGRSMYEARRGRHPELHLFPSGVEPAHFARAREQEMSIAPEIADLPRPILGYYGAIDERLDLDLLDEVACAHPEWSIVMIGPVTKIERTALPRRHNLYYPGKQPYARLPHFLRGFDVCLMPFAMNEATQSISPTKTLEFMAARKPIVSTPIPDVVASWSDAVYIAGTTTEFGAAVERALSETDEERARREARQAEDVAQRTWDEIATQMQDLVASALHRQTDVATAV